MKRLVANISDFLLGITATNFLFVKVRTNILAYLIY